MNLTEEQVAELQPLGDRILVERVGQTYKHIIIPEKYQEYSQLASVLAVGPKVKGVKKGDLVYLPGIALSHPDWEQEDYAFVTEGDVGGIFEETEGHA